MKPLDRADALRLLTSVTLGRLFFTQRALPAVRLVNHVLDGEGLIVRLSDAAALAAVTVPADDTGVVVAFEADVVDPERHLGWSVVVTGYARRVDDTAELERLEGLLRHSAPGAVTGALRIRPDLVTAFEYVDAATEGHRGVKASTGRGDIREKDGSGVPGRRHVRAREGGAPPSPSRGSAY